MVIVLGIEATQPHVGGRHYPGGAMSQTPDPEERFSLYPMEGEEVLKKLLGAEEDEGQESVSNEPEDAEEDEI